MKTLLFVCTGNTCRSPMAACLFAASAPPGWRALSAGTRALSGDMASDGALYAMKRLGRSLDSHRSQPVTRALLDSVDVVVAMTPGHAEILRVMWPDCSADVRAFDDPPIYDPYGGSNDDYVRAAADIARQLPTLISTLATD